MKAAEKMLMNHLRRHLAQSLGTATAKGILARLSDEQLLAKYKENQKLKQQVVVC